jgi:hypothetical protein
MRFLSLVESVVNVEKLFILLLFFLVEMAYSSMSSANKPARGSDL